MVFSFTKNRTFVREHFSVSQLEHTYSFIHSRNFLCIELSYAEENVLICICLQKWAISFGSYYLSKIRDLRTFVWKQLKDLGNNIGNPIQTVFTSPKIGEKLRIQDRKPPVVSRQCVVYQFKCALYDTDFIGYTTRHLRPRIEEHRATAVGAHVKGGRLPRNFQPRASEAVLRFKGNARGSLTASSAKCFSSVWGNRSWTHNRTQFARKYLFRTF